MAVPSRVFVGVTVFAAVVSLVTIPYTVAVLSCEAKPDLDLPGLPCSAFDFAQRMFLVLASIFAVGFTVLSWKALVAGARRDRGIRREKARAADMTQEAGASRRRDEKEPPGYH